MNKFILGASAATLCLALSAPVQSDHSWANYHWDIATTDAPLSLYTSLSEPHWPSIVADAVDEWDGNDPDSAGYTDHLRPTILGTSSANPKRCRPNNGQILVCSDSYGLRGWLGVATVWASGDHITRANTQLNDSYHNVAPYNSNSWRRAVACQELGHDFGLGHQNEDFNTDATMSCMEYTSAPAGNETPDAHDYEQLDAIYTAHAAETDDGGGGGGGPGGGPPDGRGPKNADAFTFVEPGATHPRAGIDPAWGRTIGYDREGRPNRFMQMQPDGTRKLTHVTWVPGYRPGHAH